MRNFLFVLFAMSLLASCKPKTEKLPSGYEYIMHTKNSTGEQATTNSLVFFHFSMRNEDSVVVSSYSEPQMPSLIIPDSATLSLQPSPIIEALMRMREGDSITIIVPLDTVKQKPMGFENAKFLYYHLALKDVKSQKEMDAAVSGVEAKVKKALEEYNNGTIKNVQTTASGLKYVIYEQGKGPKPDTNDMVSVHYYGALMDGTPFDNSFSRGTELTLPIGVGAVIPGWDEGIMLLNAGSKAMLFIPAALGYGAAGSPPAIPANADLVFYVEYSGAQKMNQ